MPVSMYVLVMYVPESFSQTNLIGQFLIEEKNKTKGKIDRAELGEASVDRTKSHLSSIPRGPGQGSTATSVALTETQSSPEYSMETVLLEFKHCGCKNWIILTLLTDQA